MGKYKKKSQKNRKYTPSMNYAAANCKTPIPPEYRLASKALRTVVRTRQPIDSVIDAKNHHHESATALANLAVKYHYQANYLMTQLQMYTENRSLNPWQLKTLITEMVWGMQDLTPSTVPVIETVRYHEESIRENCVEMSYIFPGCYDSVIPMLPTYVRVNKLQTSVDNAIRNFYEEGWKLLPPCNTYSEYLHMVKSLDKNNRYFMVDFHIPELLVFPPGVSFYQHSGYLKGKLLLQDKGSCLSSFLLNPKPGSTVLDLCAAPGLKTNHLANIMNNTGVLYANDKHRHRFKSLSKLVELTNVKCAKLSMDDLFKIHKKIPDEPKIDYVLVDPSCTYSGIFSKVGNVGQAERIKRYEWSLSAILRYALQNLPDVRRVVYTACSINAAEGERVVDDALKEIGDSFTLVDVKELLGSGWVNQGLPKFEMNGQQIQYACGSKCLRTVPEYDLCQGYFIAMFDRNFEVPIPPFVKRTYTIPLPDVPNKEAVYQDKRTPYIHIRKK